MTQLTFLTERTPTILIMPTEADIIRSKLNPSPSHIDTTVHIFTVFIKWPKCTMSEAGPKFGGVPRFSNILCACRTLKHYSFWGGFIKDELTGKITNMEECREILNRAPWFG